MKLEVCNSLEWWQVFGPVDLNGIDPDDIADAARAFFGRLVDALEVAGHVVQLARGVRATLDGWNGQQVYRRCNCGIGTFDAVSDAEWDAVLDIFGQSHEAWRADLAGHKQADAVVSHEDSRE